MVNDFSIKIQSARINVYNKDNGNSYTVTKYEDIWVCDCKSYQFCVEPQSCKHIEEVITSIDTYIMTDEEVE
jgi:hypothetical protein